MADLGGGEESKLKVLGYGRGEVRRNMFGDLVNNVGELARWLECRHVGPPTRFQFSVTTQITQRGKQ